MKTLFQIILGITTLFMSCQVQPDPIQYGSDMCAFCHMTIVDQQYAAQLVTKKGRTNKFDAIECMVHFLQSEDENNFALYLITDFSNPGKLVDASASSYVISADLPSPMGANLSGFENRTSAEHILQEHSGQLLTWTELKSHFTQNNGTMSH